MLVFVLAMTLILTLSACKTDSDYAYVKKNSKMIIGYTDFEPMNYFEGGTLTGFDTELAIAVCAKLGVTPDFVMIDWGAKEVALNAKRIDCFWNGLTITEELQESMSITENYVKNAQVIVMKNGAEYTDTSSLIGKIVVAEAGSAGEETILADENLQKAIYVHMQVAYERLLEVKAGTADAMVLDLTLAKAMTGPGTDYADLVIVDRLEEVEYGVAFRKGSDLCDKVNGIFKELTADGTMSALIEKYSLELVK
jgi:polar amino acid transport system substrate-binding protein